jgi:hypothetical protein
MVKLAKKTLPHAKFTTLSRPRLTINNQAIIDLQYPDMVLDESELIRQYRFKRGGERTAKSVKNACHNAQKFQIHKVLTTASGGEVSSHDRIQVS